MLGILTAASAYTIFRLATQSPSRGPADVVYRAATTDPLAIKPISSGSPSRSVARNSERDDHSAAVAKIVHSAYRAADAGEYENARRQLLTLTRTKPPQGHSSPEKEFAEYEAIVCLEASHQSERAKWEYAKFIESFPTSSFAKAAFFRLSKLNGGEGDQHLQRLIEGAVHKQQQAIALESAMCGPKAIAELLARLGKGRTDYKEIAKVCGTTSSGTTVFAVCQALKGYGLDARAFMLNSVDFITTPPPFIWQFASHFVVVISKDDRHLTIYDPAFDSNSTMDTPRSDAFIANIICIGAPVSSEGRAQ